MGHLPARDGWSSWAVGMATSRGDSPSHSTRRRRGRAGRAYARNLKLDRQCHLAGHHPVQIH